DGFSVGANSKYNASAQRFIDYMFRKAPKFMDIVTYTGNGAARTIAHSLGVTPNLIIFKRTDGTGGWYAFSGGRVDSNVEYTIMDGSATNSSNTIWNSTLPTASVFSLGSFTGANTSGAGYIAYLFANDTTTDGLVRTETLLTDSSGNGTVDIGWEPQFVMMANISAGSDWIIVDTARGFPSGTGRVHLSLNAFSAVDASQPDSIVSLTNTGFKITSGWANGYILWIAIRKPNKPPTTGNQVYNAIARTGTGAVASVTGVGFPPDLVIGKARSTTGGANWTERFRGATQEFLSSAVNIETTYANDLTAFGQDGFTLGTGASGNKNTSAVTYIEHCFKRAPGVFDIVQDTGTGVAHTVAHQLGVVPELIIRKQRTTSNANFFVYAAALNNTEYLVFNSTGVRTTLATMWNSTSATSTTFSLGTSTNVNTSGGIYYNYLFASKTGISKVGSYTGNGGTQTINCSFASGARFVMIKRVDTAGDWFMWDSVRGITASANDPHTSANTTAAEVTTDSSVEPNSSGFAVVQNTTTNINVSAATYFYLAFA
uniref:DUF7483 domain-containing protein n=1 Tax=Aquabacterium sp. TaxID=1872578 RepID=UPI0025C3ACEA